MRSLIFIIGLCFLSSGCSRNLRSESPDLSPDRVVVTSSQHPTAVDPAKVGSYPALTKSGAGYFYDEALEYRVWIHSKDGGDDRFRPFASYERALDFSKSTEGAEQPLVLVRQLKWINEPQPGKFEPRSDERITEWQVGWLSGSKRSETSIEQFLKEKTSSVK
jgi:hypothetical protein